MKLERSGSGAATFTARDAYQRQHLLRTLGLALDSDDLTAYVAENSFEGADTSLYLWTFYDSGICRGFRWGREMAFDAVYGTTAAHVATRTKARQARRPKRKKNRR